MPPSSQLFELIPPDSSSIPDRQTRSSVRRTQRRSRRRIYLPTDLFSQNDASYLPLPAVASRSYPRYFYIFRPEFHQHCAQNLNPAELAVFSFVAFCSTIGSGLALTRSIDLFRVTTDPATKLYALIELIVLVLAYALSLAFVYWVHRVSVEKIRAARRDARAQRSVRLV